MSNTVVVINSLFLMLKEWTHWDPNFDKHTSMVSSSPPYSFIRVSPPLRVIFIKSMVALLPVLKQTPTTATHRSTPNPLAHKKGSNITPQLDCTQQKR